MCSTYNWKYGKKKIEIKILPNESSYLFFDEESKFLSFDIINLSRLVWELFCGELTKEEAVETPKPTKPLSLTSFVRSFLISDSIVPIVDV